VTVFWAVLRKDTLRLLRDRAALSILFLLPIVFMAVFGALFDAGQRKLERGLRQGEVVPVFVDSPDSPAARALLEALGREGLVLERCGSRAELFAKVRGGGAMMGLDVPASFDWLSGPQARLLYDDATPEGPRLLLEMRMRALALKRLLDEAVGEKVGNAADAKAAFREPVTAAIVPGLEVRRHAGSFQVSVPANAVLFIFFLPITVGLTLVEERRSGVWRRMLAAPVPLRLILAVRLVPYFCLGFLQLGFLFGVGIAFFGLDVSGAWLALGAVSGATVFAAVGLGLLLGAFRGSERQLMALSTVAILLMALLGGCMFPRIMMPAGWAAAGLWTPHAWALEGFATVLVRQGATVGDVANPVASLLGFGVAFLLAGGAVLRGRG
jgi:ABC-type multidrug transport system permease subunit